MQCHRFINVDSTLGTLGTTQHIASQSNIHLSSFYQSQYSFLFVSDLSTDTNTRASVCFGLSLSETSFASSHNSRIMSLGISIGDIVLCAKIAHKLFSCVTTGRKEASKDLKELPDVLFSLCYTLHILRKEYETVITRVEKNEYLGYMIQSCQATLQELDTATAYYREIIDVGRTTKCFRSQAKIQWKRVLWSLRGDTFTKYRQKLQLHTDSLNLLLSTFIW